LMVAYGAVLELIFVDSGKVLVIMITDSWITSLLNFVIILTNPDHIELVSIWTVCIKLFRHLGTVPTICLAVNRWMIKVDVWAVTRADSLTVPNRFPAATRPLLSMVRNVKQARAVSMQTMLNCKLTRVIQFLLYRSMLDHCTVPCRCDHHNDSNSRLINLIRFKFMDQIWDSALNF
jgi:hypothetical protein